MPFQLVAFLTVSGIDGSKSPNDGVGSRVFSAATNAAAASLAPEELLRNVGSWAEKTELYDPPVKATSYVDPSTTKPFTPIANVADPTKVAARADVGAPANANPDNAAAKIKAEEKRRIDIDI
jgi:hypothetical protein